MASGVADQWPQTTSGGCCFLLSVSTNNGDVQKSMVDESLLRPCRETVLIGLLKQRSREGEFVHAVANKVVQGSHRSS